MVQWEGKGLNFMESLDIISYQTDDETGGSNTYNYLNFEKNVLDMYLKLRNWSFFNKKLLLSAWIRIGTVN